MVALVRDKGNDEKEEEEGECDAAFPEFDLVRRNDGEDEKQPQIRPNRADSGDVVSAEVLDFFGLGNCENADGCNYVHVESGGTHNCLDSEFGRGLLQRYHRLDENKHDFGRGRTKRHQSEVRKGGVPDRLLDRHDVSFVVEDLDNRHLGSDDFDCFHKHVGEDCDAQERVEKKQKPARAQNCVVAQVEARNEQVALAEEFSVSVLFDEAVPDVLLLELRVSLAFVRVGAGEVLQAWLGFSCEGHEDVRHANEGEPCGSH